MEFNLSAWPGDSLRAGFNEAVNKSPFNMVLTWPLSCFDSQSFWVPNSRVWSPLVPKQLKRLGWSEGMKLLIHTEHIGIFILPPTAFIADSKQTHPRSLLTLLRSLRGFPEAACGNLQFLHVLVPRGLHYSTENLGTSNSLQASLPVIKIPCSLYLIWIITHIREDAKQLCTRLILIWSNYNML